MAKNKNKLPLGQTAEAARAAAQSALTAERSRTAASHRVIETDGGQVLAAAIEGLRNEMSAMVQEIQRIVREEMTAHSTHYCTFITGLGVEGWS